jgi:hypothetical protein
MPRGEMQEQCRRALWRALGFLPGQLPSSDWEAALEAVKKQPQQLAEVRRIVR